MNEVVEVRMASWKAMVQERSASGLSIEEWCAANNVSESQYYYRLRQLRNTALAAAGQTSMNIPVDSCGFPFALRTLLPLLLSESVVRIPSLKSAVMRQTISSLFLRR